MLYSNYSTHIKANPQPSGQSTLNRATVMASTASASGTFHHTAVGIDFETSENEPFKAIIGAKSESYYTSQIDELDSHHSQGNDLVTSKGKRIF